MKTRNLAVAAVVGAAYASLTMFLGPAAYLPVQLRLSEALCVLPFFMPCTAWGLFVGCAMANAHELTKQAADYLCHGANGEGVLEAIRRFFPEAGV